MANEALLQIELV